MDKATFMDMIRRDEQGEFEDPIGFDRFIHCVADFFGNDREKLITFIKTEPDCVYALYSSYEEIMENFPGDDELEDLFVQYVFPVYQ